MDAKSTGMITDYTLQTLFLFCIFACILVNLSVSTSLLCLSASLLAIAMWNLSIHHVIMHSVKMNTYDPLFVVYRSTYMPRVI
jgi:hypothetical protein